MNDTVLTTRQVYEALGGCYSLKKIRYMMAWQTIPSIEINRRYYTTMKQLNLYLRQFNHDIEVRYDILNKKTR